MTKKKLINLSKGEENINSAYQSIEEPKGWHLNWRKIIPLEPTAELIILVLLALLYGGFYLPFYLAARGKLPNTADIIRLILRDKVIHNYYSGYKYQLAVKKLAPAKQAEMKKFVFDFLDKLIDLEKKYLHELYDDFDLVDDAIHFSLYNAGKFLQNLGYDTPFTAEETYISPEVFAQLSAQADENHDFFSGNGSSYVMGTGEETKDDDWDF